MISLFFYVKKFQKYEQQKTHEKDIFTARLPPARERESERERASHASKNKAAFSALCSDALFFERERERERHFGARSLSLVHLFF